MVKESKNKISGRIGILLMILLIFTPFVSAIDTTITNTNVTTNELNESRYHPINWDECYSWGDHALAGYMSSITHEDYLNKTDMPNQVNTTKINNTGELIIGDVNISVTDGVIKFMNLNDFSGGQSWFSIDLRESERYDTTFNLDQPGDNDNLKFARNLLVDGNRFFAFGGYPYHGFYEDLSWNNSNSHQHYYPLKVTTGVGYGGDRDRSGIALALEEYGDERMFYNYWDDPALLITSSDQTDIWDFSAFWQNKTDLIIQNWNDRGGIYVNDSLGVENLTTGTNAGTDLCIDANGDLCLCGSCA